MILAAFLAMHVSYAGNNPVSCKGDTPGSYVVASEKPNGNGSFQVIVSGYGDLKNGTVIVRLCRRNGNEGSDLRTVDIVNGHGEITVDGIWTLASVGNPVCRVK